MTLITHIMFALALLGVFLGCRGNSWHSGFITAVSCIILGRMISQMIN